ncbi:hypothetical protein FACS1894132_06640 [Clostridia bacterium]|nr:hypothetical protein FACS1894132_06640 [Clostridia bacterium]
MTKTMEQRIETLSLDQVTAAEYQRATNTKQVMRIVNNFNEAKLGIPVVSERDGKYYIVDGTHRVAALRRLNYENAMFIVLEGMTYEQEADYFRRQNENTRQLTMYTRFKAGLESGDEACLKINAVVEKNGFTIGTTARQFNTITAIFALMTIFDSYGEDVLDQTLKTICTAWDGNPQAKNREFLVGVSEFVHRFKVTDFAVRIGKVSLSAIWQEYLQWAQYQNRATANREMRTALCRIFVKHYNKGIPSNSKRYLKMEGWL